MALRFFLFSFSFLLVMSCSNLSQNFIKKGQMKLNGGMQERAKWSDSLTFDRYSWYHELTLMYEVMVVNYNFKSPFTNWFSKSERLKIEKCHQFRLLMNYSLDSKKVSKNTIHTAMEENGYRKISIEHFKDSLKLHPDAEQLSLQVYEISGYCKKKTGQNSPIFVNIPSYPEVLIK